MDGKRQLGSPDGPVLASRRSWRQRWCASSRFLLTGHRVPPRAATRRQERWEQCASRAGRCSRSAACAGDCWSHVAPLYHSRSSDSRGHEQDGQPSDHWRSVLRTPVRSKRGSANSGTGEHVLAGCSEKAAGITTGSRACGEGAQLTPPQRLRARTWRPESDTEAVPRRGAWLCWVVMAAAARLSPCTVGKRGWKGSLAAVPLVWAHSRASPHVLPSHRILAGRPSLQEGTAIPPWRLLVLSLGLASLFAGALPLAAQELLPG
jgi:hypothetical protein